MSCSIRPTSNYTWGYQCDPNSALNSQGSQGITYWGYPTGPNYTIAPSSSTTITFTCTQPKCYQSKNFCNVLFNSYATSSTTMEDDIELQYTLNGQRCDGSFLSRRAGYGAWQTYDLVPVTNNAFNDVGLNTFVIHNTNSSVPIRIDDFQIFRGYFMCNLACDSGGACNNSDCGGHAHPNCLPEVDQGTLGNLDSLRTDYPCNFLKHGTRSFSGCGDSLCAGLTIQPNECVGWTFHWSPLYTSDNYSSGQICLFNFNQIIHSGDTLEADVPLKAYINGYTTTPFATYYIGRGGNSVDHHFAYPSFNLVNATGYSDTGQNTVRIVNESSVPVVINDPHGINIYRIYITDPVFHNYTINASSESNGWISPSGQVLVEYGGTQSFDIGANSGYAIESVDVDGVPVGTPSEYEFSNVLANHTIEASFCGTCYTFCQAGCEVVCQPCETCVTCQCQPCESCQPCETCNTCQPCETCVTCQCQPCESCQPCETCNTCQSTCELSCQATCEVCEAQCEIMCQVATGECYPDCDICDTCYQYYCNYP